MSYSLKINNVDLSDNVIEIGDIPYTFRNTDYSMVFDYVNCELSSVNLPTLRQSDNVLIYSASVLLYNGIVDDIQYNEGNKSYSISVRHALSRLETYDVMYDGFNDLMVSKLEYINISYGLTANKAVISLGHLFDSLFELIGYTIDYTDVDFNKSLGTFYTRYNQLGHEPEDLYVSAKWNQIYFITNQIRCMGQDGIYTWDEIFFGDPERRNACTSLANLLNALCQLANITIFPKDATTFYFSNTQPSLLFFNVLTTYDFYNKAYKPRYNGYTMQNLTAATDNADWPYDNLYFPEAGLGLRKIYTSPNQNTVNYQYNLDTIKGAKGNSSISTYNHFTPIKYDSTLQEAFPLLANGDQDTCIYKQPIKDVYFPRNEKFVEIPINTTKVLFDENIINIEEGNRTSKIKINTFG